MCGIWALLKSKPELISEYIKSFNKIKRRGPDSSILHLDKNYIIGFHRLAINDLSVDGNQPFYYSTLTHNYILIVNGEIYNHKYLETKYNIITNSKSDCEVILPLFIELNENFVLLNNEIRGEYSLLIIKQDKINNIIEYYASTDPLSVRPLFYYINDYITDHEEIGFSSLLSGLSNLSTNIQRLDQGTIINGIIEFGISNKYSIYKYTNNNLPLLDYQLYSDLTPLYTQIVSTLIDCIKIRLESDRPIGCLLSGGLDSSLIAAIAAKELSKQGKQLRTFSIGMNDGTDIEYARKVSKHINSDHTEFIFTIEDGLTAIDNVIKSTETFDITTIRASVGQYLIAEKIASTTDIKVIFNGDGADECQMGYLYFYLFPNLIEARLERDKLLQQIHQFDGLRVDRNISYHGLEARVPFLDKEFVDLFYQIPTELLVPTSTHIVKHLIRTAFDKIIPDLLPYDVLMRKKEAFSDGVSSKEKSWYMILKEHYNNIITDEEFETRHNLDGITPLCKESFYYRKRFNELFGQNQQVIPRYWLANWTTSKDPSARTLDIYNNK